jgi:hypothetical protein
MAFKILVIGHKQHGKGTFAALATAEFNLKAMGTSRFGTLHMFSLMKDTHGYATPEACYNDRGNHREYWFTELERYNKNNPSQLIEDIYANHSLAEGLRNRYEFNGVKKNVKPDLIIWIDASKRMPMESTKSMELTQDDAHISIDNNTTEADFLIRSRALLKSITRNT